MIGALPQMRLHKPSGQGRVRIGGRDFFVGRFGTPEAGSRYMALLAQHGFLLPALAKTGLRFVGAAVLTAAMWTVLHIGYSVAGLLEVFLIGLYLSAALWQTGSLWVPLICHGLYNGLLFVVLPYLPMPG
jgi:hypothetical protein